MKKHSFLLTLVIIVTLTTVAFAQQTTPYPIQQTVVNNGVSLGSAIAVAISWSKNKSILWAIIHGILSWLYVIYHYFTR